MSNALNLQHPVTVPAESPYVTVQHGLKVVPDTLALTVISHTSTATPTFTQVFADSNVATWQWTNPEAGTVAVVQASCTVTRDVNNGTFSGPPVVSATLAISGQQTLVGSVRFGDNTVQTTAASGGGITPVEAIYQTDLDQSVAAGTPTTVNASGKITDTANAVSTPTTNWTFTAPADGTYLITTNNVCAFASSVSYFAELDVLVNGGDGGGGYQRTLNILNTNAGFHSSGFLFNVNGSAMLRLVQGDTVQLTLTQTNSGSIALSLRGSGGNLICIERVR